VFKFKFVTGGFASGTLKLNMNVEPNLNTNGELGTEKRELQVT